MQVVNCDSSFSAAAGARLHGDTGTLLRAAELSASQLGGLTRFEYDHLPPLRGTGLSEVAAWLTHSTEAVTRVRALTVWELQRTAASGAVVFAPVDAGWVVAGRGGAKLVAAHGEPRRLGSRALRRLLGPEPRQAVVLEPRFGLDPLSHRHCGSKSPWRRLRALISLEAPELAALVVYAVVLGGLSLTVPIAVQVLVNTIAFGSLLQPILVLATLLFGVLSFAGVLSVIQAYAVEVLQRRIFVRVAEDFARRLPALSYEIHDRSDARELTNRFFEVVTLQKAASKLLLDGLALALQTLAGLLLLSFYHPVLLAFALALVLALGVVAVLGAGAVPSATSESDAKYRVAAWLEAVAAQPEVFKHADAALFAAVRADALTRDYLSARRRHYARVLRQLIGGVGVQVGAMVALLGLGGWLVTERELTLGQLVAAELVVGVIAAGFAKLGKHLEVVYDLLASLDKLGKVIDLPTTAQREPGGAGPLGVRLSGVELSASRGRTLRLPELEIPARGKILLRADGGKAALFELLSGLREPRGGTLRLTSGAPSQGASCQLRQRAYLLTGSALVAGSVLDNLRLGEVDLDEQRAWEVLQTVRLHETIAASPQGLQTQLTVHGAPLSSGERARLCLARALLARPGLLLIDGALDELDLPDDARQGVLDAALGPDAPWTAVVASCRSDVQSRCTGALALTGAL